MYARRAALPSPQPVFKEVAVCDVVTWNALLSRFAEQGQWEETLRCFDRMQHEGYLLDAVNFACALKACGSIGSTAKGEQIHREIGRLGILEKNIVLGTALVEMYAKSGLITKAQQVFEELPVQNVVTWNALIVEYAQQGQPEEVLSCFDRMQLEGQSPNILTFSWALKACGCIGAAAKGEQLHDMVGTLGILEKTTILGNILLDMYARWGALEKAYQLLEELPCRDVVTWTALMAGYVQQGQGEAALKCFDTMQCEGHSPDAVTFACALRACGILQAAFKGKQIHNIIVSLGILEKNMVLGSALMDMYMKCGMLAKAEEVLKEHPVRDMVMWTALISAYAQQGQGEEALKCFECMQHEGHSPNVITFTCALQACGSIGAAAKGEEVHEKIVSLGMLEKHIVLGNALIDMYAKCGAFAKAKQVLKELPACDVVSWNVLIAGYAQQEQGEEALKCFDRMLHDHHFPDIVTFICALKACGSIGAVAKGEEIHQSILNLGMLEKHIELGNTLVDMYAKCGAVAKAQKVLKELPIRNVVTWTAVVVGYAQHGQVEEALKCFDDMQHEGYTPDTIIFMCALKACATTRALAKGEQIHCRIVSLGTLEEHIELGNVLVDMYGKCAALVKAQQVLEKLPVRNVITWTALIVGYTQQGQGEQALKCFDDMEHEGHSPNVVTFTCALKSCANIRDLAKGEQIHAMIVDLGILEKNIKLGNALVNMYAKSGALCKAHKVLEALPVRDVVTWNTLLAGYAQQGQGKEVFNHFKSMQCEGHSPDAVTFICVLHACACLGAAANGEHIHDQIIHLGMLGKIVELGNCLVDMHVKCAALAKAQQVLKELPEQNVVTWTMLIEAYALQGQSVEALNCFEMMQSKGVKPDSSAMTSILNACSHTGLMDQAEMLFSKMSNEYGIKPISNHYCCLADLFGRAGKFSKALSVIEKMPSAETLAVSIALLGACCKWGNVKIGRLAFEHALHVVKSEDAIYICMANIYGAAGMQEDADKIEVMRMANRAWKVLK